MAECKCEAKAGFESINYKRRIGDNTKLMSARERRHDDHLKSRMWLRTPLLLNSDPTVPVSYPAAGLCCQPSKQISMPMSITRTLASVKIVIVSQFGSISIGQGGQPKQRMVLEGSSTLVNKKLKKLVYKNKMYDSIAYFDTVTLWLQGFATVQFQIKIEKEKLEVLQATDDTTAPGEVNELVTIVVKTFIRYPCLIRLVQSIRANYPFITIIIADDSPDDQVPRDNDEFNSVRHDKHVKYIKLPERAGWNAGRAVLLSQVTTEYFVSCDDDFEFGKKTNLVKMLEIIKRTGFDIVGGGVGQPKLSEWANDGRWSIEKGKSGDCVSRRSGFYGSLKSYPDCHVVDVISNFFIGRTLTAGSIRFDPLFTQIAHREYFLDATGQLRIAVCPSNWVKHDNGVGCNGRQEDYQNVRKPPGNELIVLKNKINELWYQRNYLKCFVDHNI